MPVLIPSERLALDDLPSADEGWSDAAERFARSFEPGAREVEDPFLPVDSRLQVAADALDRSGRLPPSSSLDDLRECLYDLAHGVDPVGPPSSPRGLHLYFALLDAIRLKILQRAAQGRSTPAGRRRRCPLCGSRDIATIIWGMPFGDEVWEARMAAGEWAVGGCMISPDDPDLECNTCRARFHRDGRFWPGFDAPGPRGRESREG